MENGGLSIADALALGKNNEDGFLQGNGILIILFFLIFFSGGWNGGWNNGGSALTQAELQRGFDTNGIMNKLNSLGNGICDSTYALNNSIKDNSAALQMGLTNGFNNVNSGITNLGYQMQNCCLSF